MSPGPKLRGRTPGPRPKPFPPCPDEPDSTGSCRAGWEHPARARTRLAATSKTFGVNRWLVEVRDVEGFSHRIVGGAG